MSQTITPSVGRKVWFYPNLCPEAVDRDGRPLDTYGDFDGPFDATIAHVHNERCVNVGIRDQFGRDVPNPPTDVILVQPGDELPGDSRCYVTWMPYQVKKPTGSESGEKAAGVQAV